MSSEIRMDLSMRIIKALEADGMSLEHIAQAAGTSEAFLKKVLAGEKPLSERHITKLEANTHLWEIVGIGIMKEMGDRVYTKAKVLTRRTREGAQGLAAGGAEKGKTLTRVMLRWFCEKVSKTLEGPTEKHPK